MSAPAVTTMVFSLNEELHLPHCLDSLAWCDDVIVVDSFSRDKTREIAEKRGARFCQHTFTGFGDQRNWAIESTRIRHEWVLILDADECVPPEMAEEIVAMLPSVPEEVAAFRVARRFHMWGQWLRYSSLYPTYVVRLVRRGRVRYVNRGHAETQEVDGEIGTLASDLIDENRKGLDDWFSRQNRYSSLDAAYELTEEDRAWRFFDLSSGDPLVRRTTLKRVAASVPGRPVWYFFYSYLFRAGFRDGGLGLIFCLMKSMYQFMVAAKKYELRRLRSGQ